MVQNKKDDDPAQKKLQEEIKVSEHFKIHCQEYFTIMTVLKGMWDDHLPIRDWKHCIDLFDLGVRPIHCAPYRTGPRTQAVKKSSNREGFKIRHH